MKLLIDVQGLQTESRYRGIGRYIKNHVEALIRTNTNSQITLLMNKGLPGNPHEILNELNRLGEPHLEMILWEPIAYSGDSSHTNNWLQEANELFRECTIAKYKADIVYVTSPFEGYSDQAVQSISKYDHSKPTAIILYDLIPLFRQQFYLDGNQGYKNYYFDKVRQISNADLICAISETVAKDAQEILGVEAKKLINISAACDKHFTHGIKAANTDKELREKFGIKREFLMYTGGYDERKNLAFLIDAFALLEPNLQQKLQIVFSGKMSDDYRNSLLELIEKNNLANDSVCFLSYVEDADLVKLYRGCSIFLFPSFQEGFGLPPLEAMACGAPTLVSNITIMDEIINDPETYFDPHDPGDLARKISKVLNDKSLLSALSERGIERVKHFDWDKMARVAWSKFEEAVEEFRRLKVFEASSSRTVAQGLKKLTALQRLHPECVDLDRAIAELQ